MGRKLHIVIGQAADVAKIKVKLVLEKPDSGALGCLAASAVTATLRMVREMVTTSVATDRGHKHSTGQSIVHIWLSALPPPPPPPLPSAAAEVYAAPEALEVPVVKRVRFKGDDAVPVSLPSPEPDFPPPEQQAPGAGDELEIGRLKSDLSDLQEKVSRMSDNYHSEFANLRHKFQDTAGSLQQGMATISEQMTHQGNCLAKALPSLRRSVEFSTPLVDAGEQNPE